VGTYSKIDTVDATPADNDFDYTIGSTTVSVPGRVNITQTTIDLVAALNAETDPNFSKQTWSGVSLFVGNRDTLGASAIDSTFTVSGPGSGTVNDQGFSRYRWQHVSGTFASMRLIDFETLTISDFNGQNNTLSGESGDEVTWAGLPIESNFRRSFFGGPRDDWGYYDPNSFISSGNQGWSFLFEGTLFGPDTLEQLTLLNVGT
jgi:hypothetical protein